MNLWSRELTDSRSARVRLALSLVWSIPMLILLWFMTRSPMLCLLLAGSCCYLSVVEFILDHWSLRHPYASENAVRRIRLPWVLRLILCYPVLTFFLR